MALDTYTNSLMAKVTHNPVQVYGQGLQDPNAIVSGSLETMLNPNSQYIQNARQRGVEQAAVRGGVNSSIAAGASERAAVEAAAPLAQQAVNIQQTREGVNADNWAASQNFNRAFLGQLGTTAFSSSVNMLQNLQQMAAEDPELYTPEVTSGLNNFFNRNMNDILSRYFSAA